MAHACRSGTPNPPKMAPRAAEMVPRGAKIPPRRPLGAPSSPKMEPRWRQEEAKWRAYVEEGKKRAFELGNRGPLRFDADGRLDPEILEAHSAGAPSKSGFSLSHLNKKDHQIIHAGRLDPKKLAWAWAVLLVAVIRKTHQCRKKPGGL